MGAGKSTVGSIVAARLAVPFFDLDQEVVRISGRDIPTLFRQDGEAAFRQREAEALSRLVRRKQWGIWALGGGAVFNPAVRTCLQEAGAKVVWLRVDWPTVASRINRNGRPLLAGGEDASRQLLEAREPGYRQFSDWALDAEPRADLVAGQIIRWLKEQGHVV